MINFALLGVAGYIAPRHLAAIKEVGGNLVCACDPNDSVGVLDRYFFETRYFREFERFDRHVEKLRRRKRGRTRPLRLHLLAQLPARRPHPLRPAGRRRTPSAKNRW